jgi:hypothetical protein
MPLIVLRLKPTLVPPPPLSTEPSFPEGFFSRLGRESPGEKGGTGGFDINTIIGIISGFKIRGFES